jgi:hypothetical protein
MSEDTAPPGRPRGWVADEGERQEFDAKLAQLIGRRIEGARYFELRYEQTGGPMWELGSSFDSLDFGLELDLDDGSTWSCIWAPPTYDEALVVYEGVLRPTMFPDPDAPRVWQVDERWRDRGPGTIVSVETAWLRMRHLCLETVILKGSGDRAAVITLGASTDDGRFVPSATSVAVFFSLEEASEAGAVLPGDPRADS